MYTEAMAGTPASSKTATGLNRSIGFLRRGHRYECGEIGALIGQALAPLAAAMPASVFQSYTEDACDILGRWDESDTYVYEVEGRIVGAVSFYADAAGENMGLPAGWSGFRALAVDPGSRGRGIGRILTARCIGEARRARAGAIGIHTSAAMEHARRLYEKVGFRRCPQHDLGAAGRMGHDSAGDRTVIAYKLDLRHGLS